MVIAVACDHGGFAVKEACIKALKERGDEVLDLGTYNGTESVDYPDYGLKAALAVKNGQADKGIVLCGTGIGISIAANKVKGIRCAHVTNVFCAQMASEHNNANMIAMGGRISTPEEVYEMTKVFLATSFAGGRHEKRVAKITAIEDANF